MCTNPYGIGGNVVICLTKLPVLKELPWLDGEQARRIHTQTIYKSARETETVVAYAYDFNGSRRYQAMTADMWLNLPSRYRGGNHQGVNGLPRGA